MKKTVFALICVFSLIFSGLPVAAGDVSSTVPSREETDEALQNAAEELYAGAASSFGTVRSKLEGMSREEFDELVDFAKKELAGRELDTREDMMDALTEGIEDFNKANGTSFSLTEEQSGQIVDVMEKAKSVGIDYEDALDQAGDIFESLDGDYSEESVKKALKENSGKLAGTAAKGLLRRFFGGILGFFKRLIFR